MKFSFIYTALLLTFILQSSILTFKLRTTKIQPLSQNQVPDIIGCMTPAENPELNGCKLCAGKFYLEDLSPKDPKRPNYKQCGRCPWLCLTCNNLSKCTSCMPGNYLFTSDDKKITCGICQDGCLHCKNQGTCEVCSNRWYMTDAKKCKQCKIDHCETCSDAQTCTLCSHGYKLKDKSCQIDTSLVLEKEESLIKNRYTFIYAGTILIFSLLLWCFAFKFIKFDCFKSKKKMKMISGNYQKNNMSYATDDTD